MKAAVTDGKGNIFFEDIAQPQIKNDYQCLCKINASATCTGTDVKLINGTLGFGSYPCLFGHESVGTVIECGKKANNFRPGDLVLRPCAVYPGDMAGNLNSFAAGYTEYGLITDRQAYLEDNPNGELNNYTRFQQKVSRSLDIDAVDASMLVTLKETASVIGLKTNCSIGKKVLVLGAGMVGLSMARFSRIFGADCVVLAARRSEALQYAMNIKCCNAVIDLSKGWQLEAKTVCPAGFDIIIDGTGCGNIMIDAGELLSENGKLYMYATSHDKTAVIDRLGDKAIKAAPLEDSANAFLANAVDMKLIDPKDFYSHVMPLDRIAEGFELINDKQAMKIVFEC